MAGFEDILARIFPKMALERMQFKHAYQISKRAYDAAKPGRRTGGWLRPKTSARSETGPAIVTLRGSVRDLVRNNPYASRALRQLTSSIVGEGIKPRFDGLKDGPKRKITDRWNRFVDNADPEGLLDLYGLQALAVRTWLESGAAYIRSHPRRLGDGFATPLQISILEPDHIDHTLTKKEGSNVIIQGVEYDGFGRRAAYWIFADHPGDTNIITSRSFKSQRIDARFIQPLFEVLRPGQIHGVPLMTPAVMTMRDIADYEDAERMRKKIAACFVAAVVSDGGTITDTTEADAKGRQIEKLSPGAILNFKDGETITFGTPTDSGGYDSYMRTQLHAVAAGCGISYHELTGDLKSANYSSLREGKLQSRALVAGWQSKTVEPMLCKSIWRGWWQLANVVERLGPEPTVKWSRPPVPWVDPKKDAEAENLEILAGTKPWRKAVADKGLDPDEVLKEIADWNEKLDELGLTLTTDARKTFSATSKTDDQETDDAEAGKENEDD